MLGQGRICFTPISSPVPANIRWLCPFKWPSRSWGACPARQSATVGVPRRSPFVCAASDMPAAGKRPFSLVAEFAERWCRGVEVLLQ